MGLFSGDDCGCVIFLKIEGMGLVTDVECGSREGCAENRGLDGALEGQAP